MNIKKRLLELAPNEGLIETGIAGLSIYRLNNPFPRTSVISPSVVCFVIQGQKTAYLGDKPIHYDESNYLISSAKIPIESELKDATLETPYLGVILTIDPTMISELLIEVDAFFEWPNNNSDDAIISSAPIGTELQHSLERLLRILHSSIEKAILGKALVREVFFQILKSEKGHLLRNSALNHAQAHKVARVIQYLEKNFNKDISISDISAQSNMSSSALHDHFKSATSLSPMQFVKKLRLHNAHSLLLEGRSASIAGFDSGYNSQAQFSREFKRQFGISPSQVCS